jgi:hypothetical protein
MITLSGKRGKLRHAESEGRQEELTLTTNLNDIRVALAEVRDLSGAARLSPLA